MSRRNRSSLLSALVLVVGLGWLILAAVDRHRRPLYVVLAVLFLLSAGAGLVTSRSGGRGPT